MRLPRGPAGAAGEVGEGRGELSGIGRQRRAQGKTVKRGGLSGRTTGGLRKGGHDGH
ncbi:TPA: hypothetical protein L5637_000745 [Pseudomonas aeruginosa]|nr:hypothetical protein [Pseudomonas aeruginosa]